jgi:hypothetical protein
LPAFDAWWRSYTIENAHKSEKPQPASALTGVPYRYAAMKR